jgi:hypothetical protein
MVVPYSTGMIPQFNQNDNPRGYALLVDSGPSGSRMPLASSRMAAYQEVDQGKFT